MNLLNSLRKSHLFKADVQQDEIIKKKLEQTLSEFSKLKNEIQLLNEIDDSKLKYGGDSSINKKKSKKPKNLPELKQKNQRSRKNLPELSKKPKKSARTETKKSKKPKKSARTESKKNQRSRKNLPELKAKKTFQIKHNEKSKN